MLFAVIAMNSSRLCRLMCGKASPTGLLISVKQGYASPRRRCLLIILKGHHGKAEPSARRAAGPQPTNIVEQLLQHYFWEEFSRNHSTNFPIPSSI